MRLITGQHRRGPALLILLATIALTVTLFSPLTAVAADDDKADSRQIITTGYARITAAPDTAQVTIGNQYTGKTAAAAQAEVAKQMDAVIAALQKMGIPKEKIQTTTFQVGPEYDYTDGKRVLTGYTVTHQLRVTLNDIAKLGTVFDLVVSSGANTIENVEFSVSNAAQLQRQALQTAVADAKLKAEAIATGAGVTDLRIMRIQDNSPQVNQPGNEAYRTVSFAAMAKDATQIVPGEVAVDATVTVEFEF